MPIKGIIYYYISFLIIVLSIAACSNEDDLIYKNNTQQIKVFFNASNFKSQNTRSHDAASDAKIHYINACTVNSNGYVLQTNIPVTDLKYIGPVSNLSKHVYVGNIELEEPSKVSHINFFANCNPKIPLGKIDETALGIDYVPHVISEIDSEGLPMWGSISGSFGILKELGIEMEVGMVRAVISAKILIPSDIDFLTEKIYVCNASNKVNIFSKDKSTSPKESNPAYSTLEFEKISEYQTNEFYIPEFYETESFASRTCFIIQGKYKGKLSYYRLDFYKDGNYFLPVRNNRYIFNIVNIADKGYDTKEEALKNTGANIQGNIKIDITDASNDIMTDGKHLLKISRVNTAYLNPQNFLIATLETDYESDIKINLLENTNWLTNLRIEEQKNLSNEPAKNRIFHIYGNFCGSDEIEDISPLWRTRTQIVRITCGKLVKDIPVNQSLLPLKFLNYKEFVKTNTDKEIEIGTIDFDKLDLSKVTDRYYKGVDYRYEPHRLRIWLSWKGSSVNQLSTITNDDILTTTIKIMTSDEYGNLTILNPGNKIESLINITKDGSKYLDINLPEVKTHHQKCKNVIEIETKMKNSLTTKLLIVQKYES